MGEHYWEGGGNFHVETHGRRGQPETEDRVCAGGCWGDVMSMMIARRGMWAPTSAAGCAVMVDDGVPGAAAAAGRGGGWRREGHMDTAGIGGPRAQAEALRDQE